MGNFLSLFMDTATLKISDRGVRLEVLQEICDRIDKGLMDVPNDDKIRSPGEQIVDGIVKPATEEKKCSYAEHLYADTKTRNLIGECNAFLSHPCSGNFKVTVAAIAEYERKLPEASPPQFYFCDYLAINQHSPGSDLRELGNLVQFCETLVLMAVPWRNPLALTRLWCIFEITHACLGNTQIAIILPPDEEKEYLEELRENVKNVWKFLGDIFEKIDSKSAKARMESDVTNIGNFIKNELGGFIKVDSMVSEAMRKWFLRSAEGLKESFPEADKGSYEHAELIHQVALFYYGLSLHEDAVRLWDEAIAIQKKNGNSRWLIYEKNKIYMIRKSGKALEALPMAISNLNCHRKEFGETAETTLECKRLLGTVYKDLGMNPEAEEILKEILELFEKDQMDWQIRVTKFQLAEVLRNSGKFDDSAEMYDWLVKVNTKRVGREGVGTMCSLLNYARCMHLKGKRELALSLYEEAVPILLVQWGVKDPQTILGEKWLGMCRSELGLTVAGSQEENKENKE